MKPSLFLILTAPLGLVVCSAAAFEGRLTATLTRGGETQTFTYTVGTNTLRIERNEKDRPYAGNLIALDTGDVTLLFPHNRSFVRLKSQGENALPSGGLPMSLPAGGLPPGIGPQSGHAVPGAPIPPASIGPTNLPGMPDLPQRQMPQVPNAPGLRAGMGTGIPGGMSALPMLPMPDDALELKATGDKTNLLGYACARYEITQRDEVMEIWATDQLLPFQPYLQSQPLSLAPRMVAEQWGDLLKARKLFPLLAALKSVNGPERLRYEVKAIRPEKIEDPGVKLFQPPAGYREVKPLPF
jgi:hypothetical protein